jgi:carbonic anhydrase
MKRMTAEGALEALRAGNGRYVLGTPEHPRQGPARRTEVAGAQHPIAAIIACSDSRVSPEIIFDQGLGDVFVVRTGGNLLDDVGLASIEYAAFHLHVPLVVVLGHSGCGAVAAAMKGDLFVGRLAPIITALAPAVEKARKLPGRLVDNAARENVRTVVARLQSVEPVLKKLVDAGELRIAGAWYDLVSGAVQFLD